MSDQLTDDLARRIVEARESTGQTQQEAAERLGVTLETLQRWEAGEQAPRANRLITLAGMLNVSAAWLLSGTGDAPDPYEAPDLKADLRVEIESLRESLAAATDALDRLSERLG